MPLPLLLPLIGMGLQAGGAIADYSLNRPKKPKLYTGASLQALRENAYASANNSLAQTRQLLDQQLSARGLNNSGIGASVLGREAGNAYGEANNQIARGSLQLLNRQADADNQFAQQKQQRLSDLIGGISGAGASTLGNIAGIHEGDAQFERYMKYLEKQNGLGGSIYGQNTIQPSNFSALFGGYG